MAERLGEDNSQIKEASSAQEGSLFCSQMALEAECRPLGMFECQLCSLTAPYSYVGQQPPDTQSVVLLEESYVMRDPFTADKGRFLILGSRCSLCGRLVCVGPETPSQWCWLAGHSSHLHTVSVVHGGSCHSHHGVQFILLQEILPPLCPGEHGCFPSGNPARLGEKESSIKEACQPAGVSDMSLVGVRSTAVPCMGLPGHLACGPPCFWTRKSSVCSPGELRSPCSSSRARSHAEKAPKRQPQTPVLQS
ncbi:cysteine-rich DPF motif domain-containing protein 1 isoform X2 [Camelus ferus]|uniref:Cysteine-rich DPF motif domain-containing protein 1 n=2 Tax=Camelus TaxID=9836 RepID=A0A8B7K4L1_CAMFR|nr:cysteine-rich DPF motif domain-containing protein 1 isoform X2 [Camelus ferus]